MSFLVRAPFAAHVLPLAEVPDPVFASGVVGDGRALLPDDDVTCVTVHSPINGVVTKLKSHAAIITSTRGLSILIHLGIDTIGLRGRGFAPLIEEGDIVDAGTPLIHWDLGPVRGAGLSPCVPVIVVTPAGTPVSSALDQMATEVAVLEPLFSLPDSD
mgnify:CR=1 FL=1